MGFNDQVKPKQLTSWTPSKLDLYEQCPAKAKYKYLDKLPELESPALARGTEIHEAAEQYVTGRKRTIHDDLKNPVVKRILSTLRSDYKKKRVRVELELAFNRAWKMVHWLAKDVYCRFKIDALHMLKGGEGEVIDWKTGKLKEDGKYDSQLNAYATAVLSAGLVERVTAKLVFVDAGHVVTSPAGTLSAKDLTKAQKAWDAKVKAMLNDTKFPPRPGNHCRWCSYSMNRGGPCRF